MWCDVVLVWLGIHTGGRIMSCVVSTHAAWSCVVLRVRCVGQAGTAYPACVRMPSLTHSHHFSSVPHSLFPLSPSPYITTNLLCHVFMYQILKGRKEGRKGGREGG